MTLWVCFWFWLAAGLKSVLQKIPCANRSFLVLSSGRSGSTLLIQYLRCHPSIACSLEEPLNPDNLSPNGLTGASPSTLINYLMAQLLSWRPYSGCKIFCEQLEFYRIPFAELLSALRDPPVIVLYRKNMLDTYISLQVAFKTGVWFSQEENNECSSVEVNFDEYKHYAETERQRWKETLSAFARRGRRKVYFLSYEELIENKEESLLGIFSFLNLPPCETIAYSVRQNPFSVAQKVSNFSDVREKLGTFRGNILNRDWMEGCVNAT